MSQIPMRPMSVGELLDRIFTLYRQHFPLFVGIMVLPSIVTSLFGLLMVVYGRHMPTGVETPSGRDLAVLSGFFLAIMVFFVVNSVVGAAAAAATTLAVSEVNEERSTTIVSCYRTIGGRFWSVLGVTFMILILSFILLFVSVMVVFLLAMALSLINPFVGAATGILLGILTIVGFLAWVCRYAVAVPAIMIEKLQAIPALKRSSYLTRGFRFRVVLIALLMTLITYVAAILFQGPFFLAATLLTEDLQPPIWTDRGTPCSQARSPQGRDPSQRRVAGGDCAGGTPSGRLSLMGLTVSRAYRGAGARPRPLVIIVPGQSTQGPEPRTTARQILPGTPS